MVNDEAASMWDRRKICLVILSNLSELTNFFLNRNYKKKHWFSDNFWGIFLMISVGIEVNEFPQTCLLIQAKFGNNPLVTPLKLFITKIRRYLEKLLKFFRL